MSNLTEQEIRAFVGTKADYYLKQWRNVLDGTENAEKKPAFLVTAFLLSGLWLFYRKMYRIAFLFFGIILLETILEEVVFIGVLGKPEAPAVLTRVVGAIASIICGVFGNAWYLAHAQKEIDQVRSEGLTGDGYLEAIARRGGTSIVASIVFLVVFGLLASVILVETDYVLQGR